MVPCNKANYIDQNLAVVNYDRQAERLESGEINAFYREKLDTVLGSGRSNPPSR